MFKLIVTSSVLFIAGTILGGANGIWVALSLSALLFVVWGIKTYSFVSIPEMAVGVVFNTETQSFARFLPAGHHWLLPFVEKVEATISTSAETVSDKGKGIQAIGGLMLNVDWVLAYTLNPFKLTADMQPKMARTLPTKAALVAKRHMNNCLQHIIGEYTLDELCQPGVHKRLERELRQMIAERLAPMGFEVARVMIGSIELPAHVKAALEAAHERQMQAENEAKTLAYLQKVVSQFSEADMQRLMELERIHQLGQNGVTLVYPALLDRETPKTAVPSYTKLPMNNGVVATAVS